ncbi:MAG: FmdB family zinc ribbon protein [Candidatus Binataceae bacterium]
MPIYECHCEPCGLFFEVLASLGDQSHDCPECGRAARRVISTFAIGTGSKSSASSTAVYPPSRGSARTPLCLRYPELPLLCHMDEGSARRFVAHYEGNGDEYDDRVAAREEKHKARGLPPTRSHPLGHSHKPAGTDTAAANHVSPSGQSSMPVRSDRS